MGKWRSVIVIAVVVLAGVVGSLVVGPGNDVKASDTDTFASGNVAAGVSGAKAVVVDVTAPGMVSPKYHVVYDFEKKTVSLIMIETGDNNRIWVRQVTSYLTPTKDK